MTRIAVLGLVLLVGILLPWVGSAGECTEGSEVYIARLEAGHPDSLPVARAGARRGPTTGWGGSASPRTSGSYPDDETFACLACDAESWERWAGPIAAARFRECRESMFRDRIATACRPFLSVKSSPSVYEVPIRQVAAKLLASYGIGSVGGHDVFEILTKEGWEKDRVDVRRFMALASLQDPRTAAFLNCVYDSLQTRGRDGERARDVANILNCLYHLPGDQATASARRIQRLEPDPELRSRAQRVIDR